jgi:DnaJ-class molecular chaperone
MKEIKEKKLCKNCDGEGKWTSREYYTGDYGSTEYSIILHICPSCYGKGTRKAQKRITKLMKNGEI